MQKAIMAKQPIFDPESNIIGYELLYRGGRVDFADISDNSIATADVVVNILMSFSIDKVIHSKKAFINVNRDFIMSPYLELLPPEQFIIEILEDVIIDEYIIEKIAKLKSRGFIFALDDFVITDENIANVEKILDYISIIKIDLIASNGLENIKSNLHKLDRFKGKLLIEKVETQEEYDLCKEIGFAYYQGYFFEKPKILETKKLDSQKTEILQILNKLQNSIDIDKISDHIKNSPELSIKLLKYINSAEKAGRNTIYSINQAVILLGKNPLSSWLMLLLYDSVENKLKDPILQSALIRATIMSELAREFKRNKKEIETAFLVGLLSYFEAIMQVRLDSIKNELSLSDEICQALTARNNIYGKLMNLSEKIEKGDENEIKKVSKFIKIDTNKIHAIIDIAIQKAA